MRQLFFLICLLSAIPIGAKTTLTTQIYDIDYGKDDSEETLVLLTSGDVAKLKKNDKFSFSKRKTTPQLISDQWYQISLDKNRYITNIKETDSPIDLEEIKRNNVQKLL